MKFASDFRRTAREALKGRWWLAVGAGIVASFLGVVGNGSNIEIKYENNKLSVEGLGGIGSALKEGFGTVRGVIDSLTPFLMAFAVAGAIIGLAISIAMFVVTSVVETGYANFNTRLIDNDNPEFNNLFAYFRNWKNLSLTNLLKSLYIFLWTLLFIIPGIVASYSYAMTPYILADNPELSPSEAIEMSKEMMRGNKWRLFCLSFSFIGWDLLCAMLTFNIGNLWLNPYKMAARADFYREISGTRPTIILEPETGYEQI